MLINLVLSCQRCSDLYQLNLYLLFRVSGYMMTDKLEIPRRKVRKDWYVGLHSDPVDRSHPDIHDDLIVQESEAAHMKSMLGKFLLIVKFGVVLGTFWHIVTLCSSTC